MNWRENSHQCKIVFQGMSVGGILRKGFTMRHYELKLEEEKLDLDFGVYAHEEYL